MPQARLFNAIDLESAIITLGRHLEVVEARVVVADLRRDALDAAKIAKASEETWALVVEYLCDRFAVRS